MTKPTACIPCAKRKVRCDRQEPCSHCKRRKGDDCTYPEASPEERIKYLEELVRSLGHSPDSKQDYEENPEARPAPVRSRKRPHPTQCDQDNDTSAGWVGAVPNNGPAIIEEDGETVYLEASTWHSWDKRPRLSREDGSAHPQTPTSMRSCIPVQSSPGALQTIVQCDSTIDLASKHPTPQEAATLWTACNRNVIPLVKIAFQWELDQMRSVAVSPNTSKNLLPREHALFFTIYLNAVASLSDEECLKSLGESRKTLLSRYQRLSENSFAKADFLGQSEMTLVQASIFYISASLDELRTRSLWSFIGITLRHAERLGLHRDGTLLRLSAAETEKRRRIWWQLQHLDIALAIRSGSISLNLMANWDVSLPLNIEDEDISTASTEFPPERKGLTSMSYCLWTYCIIETQRSFRRPDGGRVVGSWQADRSIPRAQRESFMDELENCINVKFIQYCDPIVPLQLLILITARTFMWSMHRLLLHSDDIARDTSDSEEKRDKALLSACTRCLEYDIYLHSQPSLERFYWRAKGFFSWHAFVYVIGEASQYSAESTGTWELLGKLYKWDSHLSRFTGDRRKPRAAEMILNAWQAYEKSYTEDLCTRPQRPEFLTRLEALLVASKGPVLDTDCQPPGNVPSPIMDADQLYGEAGDTAADNWAMGLAFDVDPTDVDWSFWSNWE